MKEYLSVYNTDQINKYGMKLPVETLESALRQMWEIGSPMFISHDYHRALGWSKPLGLNLQPKQAVLHGISIFPETKKDDDLIVDASRNYLGIKLSEVKENDKNELTEKLSKHFSGEEIFIRRECVSVIDTDIAKRAFPNYFPSDETDKRSLISLKDLKQIGPGVYDIDGTALFAHRFYRRSLSQINNLNDIFLSKLYDLSKDNDLDVKIALDPNSIGLSRTYLTPIELEYWRGPKFNDDLTGIPAGVAVHKANERQRFFSGVERTEFWWHRNDEFQSLECEEIRDFASLGIADDQYGCRYAHSMVNLSTNEPSHLDGAIRIYDEENFIERIDLDISKSGKNAKYIKLWRIDGEKIQISTWKEMIFHFFRDNHLIGEYFTEGKGGENEDPQGKSGMTQFLPPSMTRDEGVNIFISYHQRHDFPISTEPVEIIVCDTYVDDQDDFSAIDLSALDFIKRLKKRLGIALKLDSDVRYFGFEDMDINYPTLIFRGSNSVENANGAMTCLAESILAIDEPETDRLITACFGVEYEDKILLASFSSHISQMVSLFKNKGILFPESFDLVPAWIADTYKILGLIFPAANKCITDNKMLTTSGRFKVKRTLVSAKYFCYGTDKNLMLAIPKTDAELCKAFESKLVSVAPIFLIKECECAKCGEDYIHCGCLDAPGENVEMKVIDADSYGFFWTERSAFITHP